MTAQLSRERLEEKLLEHIKHGGDSEEETMIRMLLAGMDREHFFNHIKKCSEEVAKWPEWKRQALAVLKPSTSVAVPDGLRMALSNAGIAAPDSDEVLFATHEKYVQLLVDWVKSRKPFAPAPDAYALVPLKPTKEMLLAAEDERGADWQYAVDIWASMCRAAMLNGGKS